MDGTAKFEEEQDENFAWQPLTGSTLRKILQKSVPEITSVNDLLLPHQIPVLIVSVAKDRAGHIRELHEQICKLPEAELLKMILYVEQTVDANDLTVALWRFCNNLDPKRDQHLVQRPSHRQPGKIFACLGLDGTIKTKAHDNFQRDWPNIIVADDATIRSVDQKWEKLGLGPFLPSPSLKFKKQLYGAEAVVQL